VDIFKIYQYPTTLNTPFAKLFKFRKRKQRTDSQIITNICALLMFTKLEKFRKQDYLFFIYLNIYTL